MSETNFVEAVIEVSGVQGATQKHTVESVLGARPSLRSSGARRRGVERYRGRFSTVEGMTVDERRAMGSLEADVLRYLWNASEPATPGEVHEALCAEVAYTTVMTVLTRLWRKDLVGREKQGRAYAYWALVSEADYAAKRMRDALGKAQDREAVLSRFVDTLSARETRALRRVLDGRRGKR